MATTDDEHLVGSESLVAYPSDRRGDGVRTHLPGVAWVPALRRPIPGSKVIRIPFAETGGHPFHGMPNAALQGLSHDDRWRAVIRGGSLDIVPLENEVRS